MGRVRSYKKVKSIDFFHEKKKWGAQKSDKHDLAPKETHGRKRVRLIGQQVGTAAGIAEQAFLRGGKRRKKKQTKEKAPLTEEEQAEHAKAKAARKAEMKRQPGETLKDYRLRLRRRTHQVLINETKGKTKTAKKRKEYLAERRKRKADAIASRAAANAAADPEDSDDAAAYRRAQHADQIAKRAEAVDGFGATNDRPVDLGKYDLGKKLRGGAKKRKKDNRLLFLNPRADAELESAADAVDAAFQPHRVKEEEREAIVAQMRVQYELVKQKRQQAYAKKHNL